MGESESEHHSHTETAKSPPLVATLATSDISAGAPAVVSDPETTRHRADPIAATLLKWLQTINDYADALRVTVPLLVSERDKTLRGLLEDVSKFENKEEGAKTKYSATGIHDGRRLIQLSREVQRVTQSQIVDVVGKSLFVGVFSSFDAFMGDLLLAIYSKKPQLFNGINRQIGLAELLEFESVEQIKFSLLEEEIESFRRTSYSDQFVDLEARFKVSTLRSFKEWPLFVEASQRRNLFVHADGKVSAQYISVCERAGYKFDSKPAIGQQLRLEISYLFDAPGLVRKVGFMLAHTLWRKVFPDECDAANTVFNDALYGYLLRSQWRTSAELGAFGLEEPMCRNIKDLDKRIRVVNTAIANKQGGAPAQALSLLDREDWSACAIDFKLANAVLRDDFKLAAEIMNTIGKQSNLVNQMAYHDWPLFHTFRDTDEFQQAYETVYGEPFLKKLAEQALIKATEVSMETGDAKKHVAPRVTEP